MPALQCAFRRGTWLQLSAVVLFAVACSSRGADGSTAEPASASASAKSAPTQAPSAPAMPVKAAPPDPSLPMSKRIQGTWRMDIDRVPDSALTENFRKLKAGGKASSALVQYTVTDTQFSLEAFTKGSIWRNRFDYEILREEGNTLLLKKTDPATGQTSEIGVMLKPNDELVIGTGNGQVPLQRVAAPEHAR